MHTEDGEFRLDALSQSGPQHPPQPESTRKTARTNPFPPRASSICNGCSSRDQTQSPAPPGKALEAIRLSTRPLSGRSNPIVINRPSSCSTRFYNESAPARDPTNKPNRPCRPGSSESPINGLNAPGFRATEPNRRATNKPGGDSVGAYFAFLRWARVQGDAIYDRHGFVSTVRRVAAQGASLADDSARIIPITPYFSPSHQIRIE